MNPYAERLHGTRHFQRHPQMTPWVGALYGQPRWKPLLFRWQDAFEAGDKTATELGADRVVELKAKRDELQQTLRKVVVLRPPPPNPLHEASIGKFQGSIRSIFLSKDNALTQNYLRFLVDKIVVNSPQVQMVTRAEAVVRMIAAGSMTTTGAAVKRDPAVSPTLAVGCTPQRRL
jgi:hypothetical protein